MNDIPTVEVLMATYRPNPDWLAQQESSILGQRGVSVRLRCREDSAGEGACANFASLLASCSGDYVAFSDQDDVWDPDKLQRSMALMSRMEAKWGRDVPLAVYTDARVVDAELNVISDSLFGRTKVDPGRTLPRQLILQNTANGNTMLLNAALVRKALPVPSEVFMHDHWVMLVASVFGHVRCLREPTLSYRQHDANVLGGASVDWKYYVRRAQSGVRALRNRLYANTRQAEAFALRFGDDAPAAFHACVGFERRGAFMRRYLLLRHGMFKNGFLRNLGTFAIV